MGFQEQLQEVLNRLPSERQTVLFSATLPKVLVEFVKAGVDDPVLIRLDVELQISEHLKSSYLLCRNDDKPAVLLYLLKNIIDLTKELTVVFLATRHHVEYVKDILERASISCSYVYSSLDQTARNIHIAKFRAKKVGVLLVTDIAARGIDIPALDNVINYNFPAKPKLYVHRVGFYLKSGCIRLINKSQSQKGLSKDYTKVLIEKVLESAVSGRVARAGRNGTAYSLISSDETPYLLDLHLFLDKPLKFAKANTNDEDGLCGTVPQGIIDDEADILQSWHNLSVDLSSMLKVSKNAYKQYLKSRPAPSNESIKRIKNLDLTSIQAHPIFKDATELDRNKLLMGMKNYRPNTTIFELGHLAKTHAHIMREKRKTHEMLVKHKTSSVEIEEDPEEESNRKKLENASESDLQCFIQNFSDKENSKKKNCGKYKDPEHYLSYISSEHYKEKGLGLESTFERQAANAVLDFTGDDDNIAKKLKNTSRWDRKKKKFVRDDNDIRAKKMKTESGVWIPKTYKSDLYKKWQEKNKVKYQDESDNDAESQLGKQKGLDRHMRNKWKGNKGKQHNNPRPMRRELKNKEEILKARKTKERLQTHMKKKHALRAAKRSKKK